MSTPRHTPANCTTLTRTPACSAARCGAMAGSSAMGLTSSYDSDTDIVRCNNSASALRRPSGVRSQPDAIGLIATVFKPRRFAAASKPAAIVLLPTSVSVPVTKKALAIFSYRIISIAGVWRGANTTLDMWPAADPPYRAEHRTQR